MKKLIIMASMLISMSMTNATTTTSVDSKSPIILNDSRNFNFKVNPNSLKRYLELDSEEKMGVDYIHDMFCRKMQWASVENDSTKKEKEIKHNIRFEVANMKNILTEPQYKKFIKIFNISLMNHGFGETIAHYSEKN